MLENTDISSSVLVIAVGLSSAHVRDGRDSVVLMTNRQVFRKKNSAAGNQTD